MSTMTTIKDWQDEFMSLVSRVEQPMVRLAGERAGRVAKFVPERPAFMAKMPKTTEVMDLQLKFSKRFVDEQIRFVRSMMTAMGPVFEKLDTVHEPHTPAATRPMKRTRPTGKSAKPITPAMTHEPHRLTRHAS